MSLLVLVPAMTDTHRRTVLKLAGLLSGTALVSNTATAVTDPGVTVTESGGSTSVSEAGGTDSYDVVLDSPPLADVEIDVAPGPELSTDRSQLVFTPLNWSTPQTVTVSAVDDAAIEKAHTGSITHTASSTDPNYDGIDVRDLTVSIADNDLPAELEGPLTNVDQQNETASVMGMTCDISGATIHTPTATITPADLEGAPFPGRGDTPGFLDGTATAVGTTAQSGGQVVADTLEVIVAENVIVGTVTENTIPRGGTLNDGTLSVQGTVANPLNDDRLPLHATIADTGLLVDLGSIPEGVVCTLEGYYAGDSNQYPYVIEAGSGDAPGNQTGIAEARCGRSGELRVEGGSSTYPETITFYDDETGAELGSAEATYDAEATVGTYYFEKAVSEFPSGSCPHRVRAVNTNGSSAVADVELGN